MSELMGGVVARGPLVLLLYTHLKPPWVYLGCRELLIHNILALWPHLVFDDHSCRCAVIPTYLSK